MNVNGEEIKAVTLIVYAMQAVIQENGDDGTRFAQRLLVIHDDLLLREHFMRLMSVDGLRSVKQIVQEHGGPESFIDKFLSPKESVNRGLRLVKSDEGPGVA